MNELERLEELIKIHRQKKRRKIIIGSGIGAVALVILIVSTTIWYSNRPRPAAADPAVAVVSDTDTLNSDAPEAISTGTESEASPPVEITVSLMGDCTLGMDASFGFDTSLNAYYLYRGSDYFFANVKPILEKDDLSIVNMEGTLTTETTRQDKLFAFKGDPEFVDILTAGSVEAANLANNHSHDYGDASFEDTKKALKGAGITTFGYEETAVMDIKGISVGLVGIYELNDHLERMTQLEENINKVRSAGAQLIIVVFHWGNERETIPDYNQMTLGRAAVDFGADLVVGHHAHVLQGIEQYKGKNIAYGLGNFCFGGNSGPSDMDTIIYQQTFTFENNQLTDKEDVNIVPCRITSETGFNNYQPTPAEGTEADRILQKLEERSEQISSSRL